MKPNKSRWSEKWHQLDGVQIANFKVCEDADYNEYHIVTLYPIKHTVPKSEKITKRLK